MAQHQLNVSRLVVWNIDPITRGLKRMSWSYRVAIPSIYFVWNIDPITRGLKLSKPIESELELVIGLFGILTRLLGD